MGGSRPRGLGVHAGFAGGGACTGDALAVAVVPFLTTGDLTGDGIGTAGTMDVTPAQVFAGAGAEILRSTSFSARNMFVKSKIWRPVV